MVDMRCLEEITDYKTIQNVEQYLLALKYQEDREKNGRLYKEQNLYQNHPQYLPRLLEYHKMVTKRCAEFKRFWKFLQSH